MRWLQSHERLRDHSQEKSVSKDVGRGTPVMEQMAHEVYRVVLFGVFYLQVSLLAYVPFIGEQPLHLLPTGGTVPLFTFVEWSTSCQVLSAVETWK